MPQSSPLRGRGFAIYTRPTRRSAILRAASVVALAAVLILTTGIPLPGNPGGSPPNAAATSAFTLTQTALDVFSDKSVTARLDVAGMPVLAFDGTQASAYGAFVLRCNDPRCEGGDETSVRIASFDNFSIGHETSLVLDAEDRPVVVYFGDGSSRIVRCNVPDCSSTTSGAVTLGTMNSLALDSLGNPVVAYTNGVNIYILHCNDLYCLGGDESLTSPDRGNTPSLALDSAGFPVVSYVGPGNVLTVMHCNDINCAAGDESFTAPDQTGNRGQDSSLALDAGGHPVVAYFDIDYSDLRVVHCNDANCAGGDDSVVTVDRRIDNYWRFMSMTLGPDDRPILFYRGLSNQLRMLRCGNAACASGNTTVAVGKSNYATYSTLLVDAVGNPIAFYDELNATVLHCGDPGCLKGGTIVTPESCPEGTIPTGPDCLPPPVARPKFSMEAALLGQTCGTGEGQPRTCAFPLGSTFTITASLDALPTGVPDYDGLDFLLLFAGVSADPKAFIVLAPGCLPVVPGSHIPRLLVLSCLKPLVPSDYLGGVVAYEVICSMSGTITMPHGSGRTALSRYAIPSSLTFHEYPGATETLTINCTAPPTPLPTPLSVGGVSRSMFGVEGAPLERSHAPERHAGLLVVISAAMAAAVVGAAASIVVCSRARSPRS